MSPIARLSLAKPTHAWEFIPSGCPKPLAIPIPIPSHLDQSCLPRHFHAISGFPAGIFLFVPACAIMSCCGVNTFTQALQAPSDHSTNGLNGWWATINPCIKATNWHPQSLPFLASWQINCQKIKGALVHPALYRHSIPMHCYGEHGVSTQPSLAFCSSSAKYVPSSGIPSYQAPGCSK